MAVQVFSGTEAIGATEHSLTTDTTGPDVDTTAGDYLLVLDLSDMVALDDLRVRIYEKVRSGGTQRVMHEWPLVHPQPPIWVMQHPLPLIHGWDMTLYAAVGTITVEWSIRAMGGDTSAFAADVAAIKAKTDSLTFTVSNQVDSNVLAISGDTTAADNLETSFDDTAGAVIWTGVIDQGTAQSAAPTGIVLRAGAAFADTSLVGAVIFALGSDQGYWQSRVITANALSGDAVTVDAWAVTPTGTITYKIAGGPPSSTSLPLPVNVTQIAGSAVVSSGGIPEVKVASIAANAITATSIAGDAITDAKVASDVTIASVTGAVGSVTGAVGSVTGLTASDVAAIKAKTDSLTFTEAGNVDANIQYVNDVQVNGDGQTGTEWGP